MEDSGVICEWGLGGEMGMSKRMDGRERRGLKDNSRRFERETGLKGGKIEIEEEGEETQGKRKSKDQVINKEGRKLLACLGEGGWSILNGCVKGDEEEEYTYVSEKGCTVIDYVLGNEEVREKIEKVKIGEKVDSDYLPVRGVGKRRKRQERGDKKGEKRYRRRDVGGGKEGKV